jgi:tetratricopeptide (TPR) repeat protein
LHGTSETPTVAAHKTVRGDLKSGRIHMKRLPNYLLCYLLTCLALSSVAAQAQSPREQLTQMVQQLQQTPNDTALREKIIKLAQDMKPAPAVPEEARGYFVKGSTITKAATDASQQALAIDNFNKALAIAPWWGDAYYNLAVAEELAGQLDEAQSSLKLYILTNPGEKEIRDAQDRIYALDAKKELANKDSADRKRAAEQELERERELERKRTDFSGDWIADDGRGSFSISRDSYGSYTVKQWWQRGGAETSLTNIQVNGNTLMADEVGTVDTVRYQLTLAPDGESLQVLRYFRGNQSGPSYTIPRRK